MPSQCDSACMKYIIDGGMGVQGAKLYAGVLAEINSRFPGSEDVEGALKPVDLYAPLFYAGVVELCIQVAQSMNQLRESAAQKIAIMEQIDKMCYEADKLIKWSKFNTDQIIGHAAEWTIDIFGWAKAHQDFFTALIKEFK